MTEASADKTAQRTFPRVGLVSSFLYVPRTYYYTNCTPRFIQPNDIHFSADRTMKGSAMRLCLVLV